MPLRRRWILAFLLLFGILGVISTYTRLSMTDDEDFHISCGMEWWKSGTYNTQPLHPPLARVVDASLLYLVDFISHGKAWQGTPPRQAYIDKMVLARLGVLPFYVLSCLLVWVWSRRLFGHPAALLSLALYVSLSTVTAHAGIATTDMVYTAIFLWAVMSGVDWLKKPDAKRSIWLGLSLGIMIGTKFSGLAQWPAAMACIVAASSLRGAHNAPRLFKYLAGIAIYILPLIFLCLSLIYRFSFDPLIKGIHDAQRLSSGGFGVWLYEPLHNHGVWYFFPVVFFFKTPLSFMAATILGNIRAGKGKNIELLFPLFAAIGVMLVSMTSHINLGVRHVLPLYPLLSIPAGYGLLWLWQGKLWQRALAVFLLLWQVAGFIYAYPEHIAYFNVLAGDRPEHISLDSDYDWGQDMILLDAALKERGITTAYMCARHDTYWNADKVVHAKILPCPDEPVSGWIAVGRAYMELPNKIAWLKSHEAVHIGRSTMDLYYIPPETNDIKH